MRFVSIALGAILIALLALPFVPAASVYIAPYQQHLPIASLGVAVAALLTALLDRREASVTVHAKAEAPQPIAAPPAKAQDEAQVVGFLGMLQEKGRLIDFLMDDITPYNDAQVGAAARVVHEGCRAVLREHIVVRPLREENEGATVTVPAGYRADEYRFVGKVRGEPPFSGTLVHRGWKTENVKLPRVLSADGTRLPAIAPAQIELK